MVDTRATEFPLGRRQRSDGGRSGWSAGPALVIAPLLCDPSPGTVGPQGPLKATPDPHRKL